ncbi:MAG: condensation domain-containing protein, partial [Planctomycetota bacterium]
MSEEEKRKLLAELLAKQASEGESADDRKADDTSASSLQTFGLSAAQRRLWFIDQLRPGLSSYTIPAALKMEGSVDVELLHQCLSEIIDRHEILRTRFIDDGGNPRQVIDASLELPPLIGAADPASPRDFYSAPFDLARGPLLRVMVTQDPGWVLHFAIHHIIADYWSLRVLVRELLIRYNARQTGQSISLPELPIQYVDYAAWQNDEAKRLAGQLEYWRKELAGVGELLTLPTDHPRPARQSFAGRRRRLAFSEALTDSIQTIASDQKTTAFSVVLAALQAVLFRYTGQTDFCVGSTVNNRDREETRDLIGLFVNNVAFRARPSGELTFQELLQQTHQTVVSGLRNQDVPFEQVVDALKIPRQLSHNPLFQVMFLLRTDIGAERLSNQSGSALSLTPLESEFVTSRFDLSIDLTLAGQRIEGFVEYCSDLFDESTIDRLTTHLQMMLESVCQEPNHSIGEVNLVSPWERRLIDRWNATDKPLPTLLAHEQFAAHAKNTPDRIAVTFADHSLTYNDLEIESNRLAGYLQSLGCEANTPVAICLRRGTRLVAALLAVLKMGAHYVPLDPTHPVARRREILHDCQARWLLVDHVDSEESFDTESFAGRIINLDEQPALISKQAERVETNPCDPSSLAYLIYTSGSTGRPKGVPIQHSSLSNLLASMADNPGFTGDDSLLAVTTFSFDIATLELLLPLVVGGRLVIADELITTNGDSLAAVLQSQTITVMQATPATWRLLIESEQSTQALWGLRVWCGGDALDASLAQRLVRQSAEVWNLYGPTETTIWSAALQLTEQSLRQDSVPIGGPIANTKLQIVDAKGQEVPIGVPGELCISGAGLTPGYR